MSDILESEILASDILTEPLSIAINNSISTSAFPKNAKVTSVVHIDKKTDDKYVISNFKPVSILNGFSKVYEIVINNDLLESLDVHLIERITIRNTSC